MKHHYKYLLKNIGLLTLSSFATKLLSFFLVPLYTNILTTTEYGTYDLFNTTIGVLIPILTLNIQESVLRFALDREYDRKAIVSIATFFLLVSSGIVAVGIGILGVFGIGNFGKNELLYFFLMYFSQALSGIVLAYIRGIDRIADLSVSSVICSIITIGCNLIFLLIFKWGLKGYFLANIIGPFVQAIYLGARAGVQKELDSHKKYRVEKKEMLAYCEPLIANSIAWWVNNASDRYVVIFFCGLAENGIYSVASKIPSILNVFQSIFNQAWTLSAVRDFDSEDKDGFFSKTYSMYNCMMTILCSMVIVADKVLARFLYAKDFYVAWRFVPWLTIAIVFGALSGVIGGVFSAVKNSKIFAQSTIVGAVSNVLLNIILTPLIDALGAAIATTVCYIVVWGMRMLHSKKYIRLRINFARDIVSYFILVVQAIVLLLIEKNTVLYSVEIVLFVLVFILYVKEFSGIFKNIKGKRA